MCIFPEFQHGLSRQQQSHMKRYSHRRVLMFGDSTFMKCRTRITAIFVGSFLLSFILVTNSLAQSEVFTKWIVRFDGAHAFDAPSAIAVDGKGNTLVTGATCVVDPCTNQESLTLKYDSNGNVVWRAFLAGTSHHASGLDIAADSGGNVYVLSVLNPGYSSSEVATAKYNPSGVREWVDFIASTSSTHYVPVKLAVSPEGNVYVVMTAQPVSNPPSVTINTITVKYDTNGNKIWSKQVPPNQNISNVPVFVRLDAAENVYVLVSSVFNSQVHDAFITKYDINGNLLNSYGGNQLGSVDAFRVDASGNSYVAGGGPPQAPNGAEDRIVAKFSSAGILDWHHDFGAPFIFPRDPSGFADVAVDSAGDVFFAQTLPGAIPSSGGADISVVKFNSTGTIQWTTRYNGRSDDSGFDHAVAIAVNSSDDPYIVGSSSNPSGKCCLAEFATIKYDPNGKQIWVARYNSNGGAPVSLALSGGNLLVTGVSFGATTAADWATIDYVQDAAKVNPTSLSFGNQKVGTQSGSQTVTLTNTSEASLTITAIDITGEFHLTNHCPGTLAAGATCTLGVMFTPTQLGNLTGDVTVHDNWTGSTTHPQTVQLTGTGTT